MACKINGLNVSKIKYGSQNITKVMQNGITLWTSEEPKGPWNSGIWTDFYTGDRYTWREGPKYFMNDDTQCKIYWDLTYSIWTYEDSFGAMDYCDDTKQGIYLYFQYTDKDFIWLL